MQKRSIHFKLLSIVKQHLRVDRNVRIAKVPKRIDTSKNLKMVSFLQLQWTMVCGLQFLQFSTADIYSHFIVTIIIVFLCLETYMVFSRQDEEGLTAEAF